MCNDFWIFEVVFQCSWWKGWMGVIRHKYVGHRGMMKCVFGHWISFKPKPWAVAIDPYSWRTCRRRDVYCVKWSTILRVRAHEGLSIVILLLPITRILIIQNYNQSIIKITLYTPPITFIDNNLQFSISVIEPIYFGFFFFVFTSNPNKISIYLCMHARTHAPKVQRVT